MFEELFESCLPVNPIEETAEVVSALPRSKGVLLFADDAGRPIQLLIAANIRRVAAARLFSEDPATIKKRANLAEIVRRVYYLSCYNNFKSGLRHYQIARVLYPKDYRRVVTLPRRSYVTINPAAKWPVFSLVNKPDGSKDKKVFGPFPRRALAREFIQILQNAFGLCQRPELIDYPEKAASCPYLQMSSCPAPCVGRIAGEKYLGRISDAIRAAGGGNIESQRVKLENRMRALARQREFEQAQAVKKHIQQLELLGKENYRWTTELTGFAVLHIDRSAKIAGENKRKKVQTYSGFVIRLGEICESDDFTLEGIDDFYKSVSAKLAQPCAWANPTESAELLSLATYFLYRSNPAGVWINCPAGKGAGTPEQIREAIRIRFNAEVKAKSEKP